jgi:hypothetical protein
MSETLTYEDEIGMLRDKYLTRWNSEADTAKLWSLLGCLHFERGRSIDSDPWLLVAGDEPNTEQEKLASQTLSILLLDVMKNDDGFSLLDGLSKNDRWKTCLMTLESGHALSGWLMHFSICHRKTMAPPMPRMFEMMQPALCTLLNDWTQPCIPYTDFPAPNVLAQSLFGSAWCGLFLKDDFDTGYFKSLISSTRAPFLPGLLEDPACVPLHLPTLDVP